MDSDGNGLLDAAEIKTGLRKLGMPFVTKAQVHRIMQEFDTDGNGGIDENEFIEHYSEVYERRDKTLLGKLLHALVFFPKARVSKLRSAKFIERFRYVLLPELLPLGGCR